MYTLREQRARPGVAPSASPGPDLGSLRGAPATPAPTTPTAGFVSPGIDGTPREAHVSVPTESDAHTPIAGTLRSRCRQRHRAEAAVATVEPRPGHGR
jgi:hypothetical protein